MNGGGRRAFGWEHCTKEGYMLPQRQPGHFGSPVRTEQCDRDYSGVGPQTLGNREINEVRKNKGLGSQRRAGEA